MVSQEQNHKDIENLDLFVTYYKDKTHEEYSADSITDYLFCYRKLRADSQGPLWENRTEPTVEGEEQKLDSSTASWQGIAEGSRGGLA